MKRNILAMMLSLFTLSAPAQEAKTEEVSVPLSKPGEAGTLEVDWLNGSITVTGGKGREVVIRARAVSGKKEDREEKNGLRRVPNNSLNLEVTEEGNRVEVSNESPSRIVNLEIEVPQSFDLKLSTVNHGNVLIKNVQGSFELDNVNGSITLEEVSGSAVASTVNGSIKAHFLGWTDKSPMAFSTLNGNVDITVPATAKFNVSLDSDKGEIYSDFDIERVKAQSSGGKRNPSGVYKVSLVDVVTGTVNGGGSELMIKTLHGNIYLRKK
jgi:hypothetical protein